MSAHVGRQHLPDLIGSGGQQLGQRGSGVPTATIVWFSKLLQAGGNRLPNAIQLVGEVLAEAVR